MIILLGDVARFELVAHDYSDVTTQRGKPALIIGVFPRPGANVVGISDEVRATMERVDDAFPAGVRWSIPFDTTDFVRVAIKEVFWTLGEAIILVFLVVFLFLQNWRTTLIPCLEIGRAHV